MIDPLAEIVTLLRPGVRLSKVVSGAGRWCIRRTEPGQPFFCVLLEGSTRLAADGHAPLTLLPGDFVLIPAAQQFTVTSLEPPDPGSEVTKPLRLPNGDYRLGLTDEAPDARFLVGHGVFQSTDAALLVSLLPRLVVARGEPRLGTLVDLISGEARAQRPAREVILNRLLEVLLIEALRSAASTAASPGLLRALNDPRLAAAIRQMHEHPARPWTVAQMAKAAALSRSAFHERFTQMVGTAPMDYLLTWRMATAKRMLHESGLGIAEIARRIGYSSASTFSVAFSRRVGMPPGRYARAVESVRELETDVLVETRPDGRESILELRG